MNYLLEEIGGQLRKERVRHGLTQRSFAKKAGTNQARISNIENGEVDLRVSTLVEIARSLDLEFMLVPRQHVPAVNTITRRRLVSTDEKTQRAALAQLNAIASRLDDRFPEDPRIGDLVRIARELSNFRLHSADTQAIREATKALRLIEETPALVSTAMAQANELRLLRNKLAHNILDREEQAPRPAYQLDEEDND